MQRSYARCSGCQLQPQPPACLRSRSMRESAYFWTGSSAPGVAARPGVTCGSVEAQAASARLEAQFGHAPRRRQRQPGRGQASSRSQVSQLNDGLHHRFGSPGRRRESGGFDAALLRPVGEAFRSGTPLRWLGRIHQIRRPIWQSRDARNG